MNRTASHRELPLSTHLGVFLLSISLQITAVVYFYLSRDTVTAGLHIHNQVPYLMTVCVACTIALLFNLRPFSAAIVLCIRFLVAFIIGYAMESRIGTELLLYLSVLIECACYFRPAFSASFSLMVIAVAVLWKHPQSAWGQTVAQLGVSDRILMAAVLVATVAVSYHWRIAVTAAGRKDEQIARLDHAVKRLTRANVSFQDRALSVEIRAAEEERNRISRDIHDSVGYTLTNIVMMTRFAERISRRDLNQLDDVLEQIGEQAKNGLNDMRAALRRLRSTKVDRLTGNRSITRLISEFERATDVRVRVYYSNAKWPAGGPVDDAIFHVVQEGLTNAFRHGRASQVWVQFWCEQNELSVSVEDNGRGASEYEIGIGLQGMRERLEQVGGTLRAESRASGFRVSARIPVIAEAAGQ